MEQDSLTLKTLSGEEVRLKTTLNNMSKLETTRNGPEHYQVVDISSRQTVPEEFLRETRTHQNDETQEENYDSDDQTESYNALTEGEDEPEEESTVLAASLMPDITIQDEVELTHKKAENASFQRKNLAENKNPDFASFQKNFLEETSAQNGKNFLEETSAQNGNCFISSKEEEEEKAYTRMIRDKDKAMEIHQKFGHMHFQKILESVKRCVSLPEYDRITRSVIYHLKNIKCDKCALTRSNLIRHPVSKTNQRAQYFGQVIQCDVLYGPNRFKAKSTPLRLRLLPRHL